MILRLEGIIYIRHSIFRKTYLMIFCSCVKNIPFMKYNFGFKMANIMTGEQGCLSILIIIVAIGGIKVNDSIMGVIICFKLNDVIFCGFILGTGYGSIQGVGKWLWTIFTLRLLT
jgi:hypothetical protein